MHRLIASIAITVSVLGAASAVWSQPPATPPAASPASTGMVVKTSPHPFDVTLQRLTKTLEAKGLSIFAAIDHRQNAATVELELPATTVVIFGNPKLGTPLMQCNQSLAIDLPQKVLIWQKGQTVQLAYNDPAYLSERHRLQDCGQEVVAKISMALNGITDAVIQPN